MDKIGDNEPPYVVPHKPSGLPNARPNIVIFVPYQLRYDALHCSGMNPIVKRQISTTLLPEAYDSQNVMSKHQSVHNLDVPCSQDYIRIFLVIGHWKTS